ncbi:MAG: hypothetical protein HRT95_20445 [Moritella sp.]|uniref:hypothetical protein n=1 Tax=Moritella sp. TaxID=78556 RepID=UPI001E05C003|nr:hypothetical protein [Moritella sp.]NQZ52445.1 hypothetical protein [Moritella sp.]
MEEKRSVYTCLQGVGIVFSFILVNDIAHGRWFDVGLMFVVVMIALAVVDKISKIE